MTFVRKNSYSYDELIECGHGRLFGPGNAQLPLPPMLMLDRITHISETGGLHGKGEIIAELDLNPDLWFFRCHFENDPVMPGCLGLLSRLAERHWPGAGARRRRSKIQWSGA